MIRRELKDRLINLEKRIAAAVQARHDEIQAKRDEVNAPVRYARSHAIAVAVLALYGEPKIDEPLSIAQARIGEMLAKEFAAPAFELSIRDWPEALQPIFRASHYSPLKFETLPGVNDNLKFERIFSEAPAWLLKFTAVEWDAKILGLKIPDLVGTPELGCLARVQRNCWPLLPLDTIDYGGPCSKPDESWEKIVEHLCREMVRFELADRRSKRSI
jgi:hypothetical protein